MDSLQEVFVHPPEPCETLFIMDGYTLFHFFWTDALQHPLSAIKQLERSKTMFNITLTGFI